MPEPVVLTFDLGTQSARAMIVDTKGEILASEQKVYSEPYFSKKPGWAEQRPEYYWDCLCQGSRDLKAKAGPLWERIAAVSLSTIRDSSLCLDKDLRPLGDCIVWLDQRHAVNMPPPSPVTDALFRLSGLSDGINIIRRTSQCNWFAYNDPDRWRQTAKFVLISTWLTYKFCGNLVDSNASAIGHIPFDTKSRTWMKKSDLRRGIFAVEDSKLFDTVEPGETLGNITAEAAAATGIREGLPLIATGSDKGCETLGLSCLESDKGALSFGTTATIQTSTRSYMEPQPRMPAYPAVVPGYYNPEIQIYRGYWLLSWFKKEFAAKETEEGKRLGVSAESLLDARLREIAPGCDGLVMAPFFTPGVNMPFAKGAVIGFSEVHTRIHLYRSIIEGLNFSLIEGLKGIEKRGGSKVTRLYVAGGGSKSDEVCRITASMFGLPVYRTQTSEVTGIGSSLAAFVALKVFPTYEAAIKAMVHIKDEFLPDEAEHRIYEKIYDEVFVNIFRKLSPLYRKMEGILK